MIIELLVTLTRVSNKNQILQGTVESGFLFILKGVKIEFLWRVINSNNLFCTWSLRLHDMMSSIFIFERSYQMKNTELQFKSPIIEISMKTYIFDNRNLDIMFFYDILKILRSLNHCLLKSRIWFNEKRNIRRKEIVAPNSSLIPNRDTIEVEASRIRSWSLNF